MSTEPQTLVGVIENIEIKDGKSDRGSWRLHKFKIRSPAGTRTYSTFDKGWPTNLTGGETYRFTYVEKPDGEFTNYNLTSAMQVDPSEFGAQPASNGEFTQPYEPLTDVAKAAHQAVAPQPEFKSPSRSYDQNQDITRRSIERQIALKAAVEIALKDDELWQDGKPHDIPAYITSTAGHLFAWLREAPTDVRSSPADPPSEPEGTEEPTESDGEPALFPPEQASTSGALTKAPRFYSLDALIKFCEEKYGINEAGMVEILGKPLSEGGMFSDMHAKIAAVVTEQGGSDG